MCARWCFEGTLFSRVLWATKGRPKLLGCSYTGLSLPGGQIGGIFCGGEQTPEDLARDCVPHLSKVFAHLAPRRLAFLFRCALDKRDSKRPLFGFSPRIVRSRRHAWPDKPCLAAAFGGGWATHASFEAPIGGKVKFSMLVSGHSAGQINAHCRSATPVPQWRLF